MGVMNAPKFPRFAGRALGMALLALSLGMARAQSPGDIVPDRYIVQLTPDPTGDAAKVAARHGLKPLHIYQHATHGFSAIVPPGLVRSLTNDPAVAALIPDRVVGLVAGKGGGPGGGGGSAAQVVPKGVQRIGAQPGATGYTGAGVGVAIVDTGIDFNHVDLSVSPSQFNVYGSSAQDDNGHGTHVSGIVAARNNTVDVVGVAPEATLYAVKVLSASGSGYDSDIIAGLDWIAANGATLLPAIKVANMSLGRPGSLNDNPALRQAMQSLHALGVTVVVAAGNDPSVEVSQMVPATYPEVIAVASTTAMQGTSATSLAPVAADTASYFTTDGRMDALGIGVTVSAPGEDAENILKGYRLQSVGILSTKLGGGTTRMSGTSMAAPHVTGVIALQYQQTPALTPYDVKTNLMVGAALAGAAPLSGRTSGYSFDGEYEGILSAPGALTP